MVKKKKFFPLELAQFAKGEKVGEVIVILKNRKEALPSVVDTLKELGVNIFRTYGGTEKSSDPTLTFLIFFEKATTEISLGEIKSKLASLDDVISVFVRGYSKLLVDDSAVPLLESGSPAFLMRAKTFTMLKEGIAHVLGSEMASGLLWSGWEAGRHDVKWLKKMTGKISPKILLKLLLGVKQSAGWGVFKTYNFDIKGMSGMIAVKNSIETVEKEKSSRDVTCHMMRGYLAGVLSEIFQKPIDIAEIRCRAQGYASCEFKFGK